MSTKLSIEAKRIEALQVDPKDLIVRHEDNGRFGGHTEEHIAALAESIKLVGQRQPVGIVKQQDGTLKLVYGYGRYLAVLLINLGKQKGDDGWMYLEAKLIKGNALEQYKMNVQENMAAGISHMDYAEQIRKFRLLGLDDKEIRSNYPGRTEGWFWQHARLLDLEREWQVKVHNGDVSLADALQFAKLLPEEQGKQLEIADRAIADLTKNLEAKEPPKLQAVAGTDVKPETKAQIKAKEAAAKKVAAAKKKIAKKVTAKIAKDIKSDKSKAPLAPGKRSWNETVELLETVGPAYSERMQCLADILIKGLRGEIREDDDFIEQMETLLGDMSLKKYDQVIKAMQSPKSKSAVA